MSLTDTDRRWVIAQARELAVLGGLDDVREWAGARSDLGAYIAAFGRAQAILVMLADLAESNAGSGK